MHISGDNFQFGKSRGNGDYYFSKIVHIWGWATWRRAWKYYDLEMKSLEDFTKGKYINDIFNDKISEDWINTFIKTKNKEIDTWDHQWTYAIWSQNGLAILPNKNLVENIGFGVNATHTKNTNPLIESNKAAPLSVVSHPNIRARDYDADLFFYKKINPNHNIVARIINKIKNYAKKYQNNL